MSPPASPPGPYSPLHEPCRRAHVRRCMCVRRSSCLLAGYTVFYLLYVALGAWVFSYLEQPAEQRLQQRLEEDVRTFLASYNCVPEERLDILLQHVIRANNRGVSASKNISSGPNWSFGQSFFFSTTVVTTIGYGHVTPLSEAGKIFCLVFALIGIPMTLVLLTAFVERLMVPSTVALQWLGLRLGHVWQPFSIRMVHLTVVGTLVVSFFFLVPAGIFYHIEGDWTFLDSLYYCFISLTTVGLGDYIPGDSPGQTNRPIYKLAITGYLLVGLVMMMWLLTVFAEIPQLNLGIWFLHQSDETTSDPEKMRLSGPAIGLPNYSAQSGSLKTPSADRSTEQSQASSPDKGTPTHGRR
ncbi:potassium channel subfamily K member 6-like [Amphibalanus amphitrite]|uniref:potassium channel subfamily K member 6-like n=1 Tax=Amphibalanus amphitrite TaxID=1232801 RepID=UPI001C8FE9AD|nr:potassium channel subfamily K member 6-like [Amphibalanus amphitrite]XP_043231077.1 potassium channel subfamily K member 6-like [Amphibalanus amphitrite]